MSLSPGALLGGRYRIESQIGQGGMATVYRARHDELGTLHAIKVVDAPSSELRQRLLQEGRSQGSLRHPNVLSVTDLVDVDGSPGLVLEFMDGPTLASLMHERRLSLDEVTGLARQILAGVSAAHRHGLVHRDLKPSNVLLSVGEGIPIAKVADFGLVKALHGEHLVASRTRTGMTMGTPGYMAPEQISDAAKVDQRADIFALGAILYEMLTGRRPFRGEDMVETLQATKEGHYDPPRGIVPDAPDAMITAIEGALVPEVEGRFQDCAALEAVWNGQPLPARKAPSESPNTPRTWVEQAEDLTLSPSVLEPDLHPTLEVILDGRGDPQIETHLERCAPCRVEVRLYEDAFGGPAPVVVSPRVTVPTVLACLGSIPLVVGMMIQMCDGLKGFNLLGPWAVGVLLLSILGTGWLVRRTLLQRAGRPCGPASWLVFPGMVVLFGLQGSAMGFQNVQYAVDRAVAVTRGSMTAAGVWVALSAEGVAFGMATVLLLGAAVGATVVHRTRVGGPPGRIVPLAALSLGAGSLLWAADSVLREDAPAPFLVLLVLIAAAASCSLVATTSPPEDRVSASAKLTVWISTVCATTSAALGVHVAHQRRLFQVLRYDEMPTDWLLAAEQATEVLSTNVVGMVGGWVVAAVALVCVAAFGGLGLPRGTRPGIRRWAGLTVLLVVVVFAYGRARREQAVTAERIVPAFLAQSVEWYLPGVELEVTGTDSSPLVLQAPEPLEVGDRIIAVHERPVEQVGEMLSVLRGCLCEGASEEAECRLVDTCLSAGTDLPLTVIRDVPGQGPRHISVLARLGAEPLISE
ncbi:MAG: serine/threonine-protein kinase [Myxococcota bacterium]|nr:serine/threonine-protein kinase [Myxococcota bacterium]